MEAVINVVLPVFAIVLAGYATGRRGILGEDASAALNGFVFYVALPVLLFISMARVEAEKIFNWDFIGVYAVSLLVTMAVAMALVKIFFPARRLAELSLNGMSSIYGNTGYMGIPLVTIAFGMEATVPAVIATVVNAALIFGLAGAMIEADLSAEEGAGGIAKDIFWGVVKNPLFLAPIAGVLASVLELKLPSPIEAFCDILGAAAGPCALFSLGLFLVGKSLKSDMAEVSIMVILKLFVQPAVAWVLIAYVFELDHIWAATAMVMAALPTGTGAFVVAQRFNIYVERTSAATVVSTVLSVVTLSVLFTWYG